jgi:hypothetical protein
MMEEVFLDRKKRPALKGKAAFVRRLVTDGKGRIVEEQIERIDFRNGSSRKK